MDSLDPKSALPMTFAEYLFFHVLQDEKTLDTDIAKKFAKANQQQREWPIAAASLQELESFFHHQSILAIHSTTMKLKRDLVVEDYVAFRSLLDKHLLQIEANFRSSVFALRTVWKDYEAFIATQTQ